MEDFFLKWQAGSTDQPCYPETNTSSVLGTPGNFDDCFTFSHKLGLNHNCKMHRFLLAKFQVQLLQAVMKYPCSWVVNPAIPFPSKHYEKYPSCILGVFWDGNFSLFSLMFILDELSKAQAISEASMWSDKTADCSAEFIIYGSHMVYGSHIIAVYAAPSTKGSFIPGYR